MNPTDNGMKKSVKKITSQSKCIEDILDTNEEIMIAIFMI